jgi:hypothetical protein
MTFKSSSRSRRLVKLFLQSSTSARFGAFIAQRYCDLGAAAPRTKFSIASRAQSPLLSHQRRINAALTIAKPLPGIGGMEGCLQASIKVDGTFA